MANQNANHETELSRLVNIMRALRDIETGCPWDIQQDFASIAPYTIEEAYEVEDAIRRENMADLKEELGDLLFQVIFHAHMASEANQFDLGDVIQAVCEKMIRRHPHVFSDRQAASAEAVKQNWEDIKSQERAEKQKQQAAASLLDDIPLSLPALTRAVKIQKRAARVGFDWPDLTPIFDKLDEEIKELKDVLQNEDDQDRLTDELGDVLFVIANLARKMRVDPEAATRSTNAKFTRRFQWMERQEDLRQLSLERQEVLWQASKRATKS
jgi:MazG family protein